jgi:hypothetical protein
MVSTNTTETIHISAAYMFLHSLFGIPYMLPVHVGCLGIILFVCHGLFKVPPQFHCLFFLSVFILIFVILIF